MTLLTSMNANRITRLIILEKVSDYEEVRLYAYADGENVRVLTEGDKDELINKIDELSDDFVPITTSEIQGLF